MNTDTDTDTDTDNAIAIAIARDVAAIVAKHGATAVLQQLHLAATMVAEDASAWSDCWLLHRALGTAARTSHQFDNHLANARMGELGMVSATDILAKQEK